VITKRLLLRAWAIMGLVSAVLVLGAFFAVLFASGWRPGADTAERASLRSVGLTSNRLLLGGVAFEIAFAAAVVYLPRCRRCSAPRRCPRGRSR